MPTLKVPARDGGSDEPKDAKEDAKMGVRCVRCVRGGGVARRGTADLHICVFQGTRLFVGRARSLHQQQHTVVETG